MDNEGNSSLSSYSDPAISSDASVIEGIINYLSWRQHPPRLYLYDKSAIHSGIPLAHFVGEQVEISVEGPKVCTSCGEPSSSSPCHKCGTEPPFANCIKQPARDCTFHDCPFETFKQRNCSEQFAVYLAASDRIKIGISRAKRLSARWHEQAASHAIRIAYAPNRLEAGYIEAAINAAREELEAVLGTRVLSQSSQTWSESISNPIETLIDATILAGDHFPEGTEEWFRFPDRDRDQIRRAIKEIRALSPGGPRVNFPHGKISTLSHLPEGEPVTGEFVGVRGQLLVSESGFLNCNTHGGYNIRIRTSAPHTEYLSDPETVPNAASPETDPQAMVSSAVQTTTSDDSDKMSAADFM